LILKKAFDVVGTEKINAIPNSGEKFMTFSIGNLKFIDSFQFMASSLDKLAENIASWPAYYLLVEGHARPEGDVDANLTLARERAEAAAQHLIAQGVSPARVKARAGPSLGEGGESQSVTFVVGQLPY